MDGKKSSHISSYLQYLPGILQADPFLGRFLLAFEEILSGSSPNQSSSTQLGLEEYIDGIHTYFNPGTEEDSDPGTEKNSHQTPSEFLPWLAGWVALSLRDDWEEKTKRQFIKKIVPLYRHRGTKTGLEEILKLYLRSYGFLEKVEVSEFDNLPDYFQVQLTIPDPDFALYWRMAKIAKAIIDQEKPVHTFYALKILVPTMRITGYYYPINLDQPATIEATVNVKDVNDTSNFLILSIKGSGQAEPYARKAGNTFPLKVTYTVTPEQFKRGEKWHLAIANPSIIKKPDTGTVTKPVTVTVTITLTTNTLKKLNDNEEFPLVSGLKIIDALALDSKGNLIPPDGNTILGTISSENLKTLFSKK